MMMLVRDWSLTGWKWLLLLLISTAFGPGAFATEEKQGQMPCLTKGEVLVESGRIIDALGIAPIWKEKYSGWYEKYGYAQALERMTAENNRLDVTKNSRLIINLEFIQLRACDGVGADPALDTRATGERQRTKADLAKVLKSLKLSDTVVDLYDEASSLKEKLVLLTTKGGLEVGTAMDLVEYLDQLVRGETTAAMPQSLRERMEEVPRTKIPEETTGQCCGIRDPVPF
jgi:hypothetical protein